MLAITCSSCQKKLSVKDDRAGKKVKCPGCGHVTVVATQPAGVKVSNEDTRTMAPASKLDGPALAPKPADASNAPTNPFLSKPDATQGVKPSLEVGHDASLTDFLAPPQADDELGRLGEFRILKILGHGGMGVVFLGEDSTLGRKVAIKAMLPHLAGSKSSQQRFLREARAAATLEHDHIVAIHHVGVDRGAPYIVMPFLKGEPLDERLRRDEKIPLAETLRIGREIAAALAAAHAMGFVHRDIKPANVWLESRGVVSGGASSGENSASHHDHSHTTHHALGRVKILDFGLARAVAVESELTQQGAVVGTPAYMAPEQARGESVDARCDVWSLGVVLYRMCAGEMPFKGANALATLRALEMNDPPPPAQVNAEIPAELSGLVMKLLAKNPADRVNSAAEVVQALQAIEELIRKKESREPTIALAVPVTRKLSNDQVLFAVDDPPRASSKTLPVAPAPKPTAPPASNTAPPRRRAVALIAIALFAVLGALLLGVGGIYYWQTNNGIVRIEINDENIKVAFDKNGPTITGVDKQDIKLTPGQFGLTVERGDLKFDTDKFILKRGETVTLKIEWFKEGKLQVVQGDKVIGQKSRPVAPVVSTYALSFDGMGGHVDLPSVSYAVTEPITLEGYFQIALKTDAMPKSGPSFNPMRIFGNFDGKGGIILNVGDDRGMLARIVPPGTGTPPSPKLDTLWHHLAVCFDGGRLAIYRDGKKIAETKVSGERVSSKTPIRLGAAPDGFGKENRQYMAGQMREVRISKMARYDKDFTPAKRFEPDADTLALYHFDEGSGDVLKDSSGNGHHGKIVGAKWVKADGTPIAPAGTSFALHFRGGARTLNPDHVVPPNIDVQPDSAWTLECYATPTADIDNALACPISSSKFSVRADKYSKKWVLAVGNQSGATITGADTKIGRKDHLALVRKGGQLRLFVNGKMASPADIDPAVLASFFDKRSYRLGVAFTGTIQEVRFSKVARYDNDFTPAQRFEPDADTLALYHCDEGSGDVLKDSSGNGHHGKIVGAKWVKADGTPITPPPPPAKAPFDAKGARAHQDAWARYLQMNVETTNSAGMKMVVIPPGEFQMGATPAEIDQFTAISPKRSQLSQDFLRSEGPQHAVVLTRPFLMSAYPVTLDAYRKVMGPKAGSAGSGADPMVEGQYALTKLKWLEAAEFCNRLSESDGLRLCYSIQDGTATLLDTDGYRLPTEAEWEYACRAGTTTLYFHGNDPAGTAEYRTPGKWTPVGSKKANPFGLFDMAGMAGTWCQDFYDAKYYESFGGKPAIDPQGPAGGKERAMRGSFWGDNPDALRSARRWSRSGELPADYLAQRVVRTLKVPIRPGPVGKDSVKVIPEEKKAPYVPVIWEEKEAKRLQQEWARKLKAPVEEKSKLGIVMVLIPPAGEALPKPYLLGKYEVTQGEWEQVMDHNPSFFGPKDAKVVKGMDTSRFPVERVNWFDGVEFCNKLSEREGLKPYYDLKVTKRGGKDGKQIDEAEVKILGGSGYHIPTDAEWEHGCRAGTKTRYHCGDKDEDLLEYAWFDKNSEGRTHTVGEKKPNAFGLYDMHGNVGEWTEGVRTNAKTEAPERALRGGNWLYPAGTCAVGGRSGFGPAMRNYAYGLRVARVPSDGPASAAIPPPTPEEIAAKKQQDDWAAKLKLPVEATNKIGMMLRLIPPAGAALPLLPQKAFYLGKYEVTQGEWQKVMGYNPSFVVAARHPKLMGMDTSKFPVDSLSWYDSVEFCNKFSMLEGLKPYYELTVKKRSGKDGKQIDDAQGEDSGR